MAVPSQAIGGYVYVPPSGYLDTVTEDGWGWAFYGWADPGNSRMEGIVVEVDGHQVGSTLPEFGHPRPDVRPHSPYVPDPGYKVEVFGPLAGQACAYAVVADRPKTNLGCLPVPPTSREGSPIGYLDSVSEGTVGHVRLTGWVADPDTDEPLGEVFIYSNGRFIATARTTVVRPDVNAAVPFAYGIAGFDVSIPSTSMDPDVCAYAINQGRTGLHTPIGCLTAYAPFVGPRSPDETNVTGWIDFDTNEATQAGSHDRSAVITGWAFHYEAPAGPGIDEPTPLRVYATGGPSRFPEQVIVIDEHTGVPRPDVAEMTVAPPNSGFEIEVGSGEDFALRTACVVAIDPRDGQQVLIGCIDRS